MANDLAVIETQLKQALPMFRQALMDRMPPERFMRTILVSCEKTPKLLECTRQSLMSSSMTAAFLGLEVDGLTGQGFLVPYNDNKNRVKIAQFQIGYKGFNTLGARSGYSITASVVREKDEFDYSLGTGAYVRHRPSLTDGSARIIAAWACAESKMLPALVEVMPLAELEAVQKKSKAAGSDGGFSPWDDPLVGRPAMFAKTPRRRLSRSMPLNALTREYHVAARIEEAFQEQGLPSAIRHDGQLIIDGHVETPFPQEQASQTPPAQEIMGPKPDAETEKWKCELMEGAENGVSTMKAAWDRLCVASPRLSKVLKPYLDKECWPVAEKVDRSHA